MTDDRTAFRFYAGAALAAAVPQGWGAHPIDVPEYAVRIANAMLAAEKERFPVIPDDKYPIESYTIHPLAGTANDGE